MQRAPILNLPAVVLYLALGLIAVHGIRHVLDKEQEMKALLAFAFIPARYGELAAQLPGGSVALLWSPVTYAFLHADAVHLVVNLVWMASFGTALARRLGTIRFLIHSAVTAAAGAALHYATNPGDGAPLVGASAAVSGMMAGTARFAFAPGGALAGGPSRAANLVPAVPLGLLFIKSQALVFILVWFALNLLFGLGTGGMPGVSGPIAWEAHIGGFLAGLFVFSVLDPVRPERGTLAM